jgi:hypothetical protein
MQIWIYFSAGAGGDGFANLLEHCDSVTPVDRHLHWRIHRRVDNKVKFYAPTIDEQGCFRRSSRFNTSTNKLTQSYIDLIEQGTNTICTSHDVGLTALAESDSAEILNRDQVRVFIPGTPNDLELFYLKNLQPEPPTLILPPIDLTQFDYVLDIVCIQQDWNYVHEWCQQVGLTLPETAYREYQSILTGSTAFDYPGVESFQSSVTKNGTTYTKI